MPSLLSSPACLTVIWFLSWSLCPSHAQIGTDEVSGVQYGRLESNVTLECGRSEIGIPVEWRHNHSSVLPWHKVTSDGRLVLLHVNQSAQGNYSCYDNSGLLRSVRLRLGHPPGLLSISCRVPNHTHVHFSWRESVKTFLPAEFNATFRGKGQEGRPCIMDITNRHCDVHNPAFWLTIHMLSVTETNALGSQSTSIHVKLHELLKPDPPESVFVKEIEGFPMRLMVTWQYPSTWQRENAFILLFHIRYKPCGSKVWSEIFTEEDEVLLSDVLVGHFHQVQVRARDEVNSESQWSEWTKQHLVGPWKESVSVKEMEGFPMKLKVTWHYPPACQQENASVPLFHIRYKPFGSKVWSEIFTEEDEVVISDALADHLHQVQVRARDNMNSESQWSEWTKQHLVRPWTAHTNPDTPEDTEPLDYDDDLFITEPKTSTMKTPNTVPGDEGNLGLVILLVLFSVFILTTVLSLIFIVWMRQRRHEHATKQELASMVKMKSIPI
ncbi:interleukin-11 receptor subunit alpha isoform X1 [Kryptolebias marmoratus]|uniref:Interleukin-11 receptor subunit alpha-like n=1 Tax=Kryptolebias marmoratus TaxID=37003 RepID=A0A3Q3AVR4_KRYMA|nr:interleukin-11 receptor subunit alpha isoform X1 [Kryptolebias marmoratus]